MDRVLERVPAEMRPKVKARVQYAEKAVKAGSAAVLVAKVQDHMGATDSNVYNRVESNGTLLFAVIRGQTCVTMFWRREDQPKTPVSMRVDRVLKAS
jgi:hypothetical protein